MLHALVCSYLLIHDWDWLYILHHTTKPDYNSSHHDKTKKIATPKMAETSNIKNISQNVRQCRDGKPWKMTQTRMGWHTLHTHWQTRIGWHTLHTHTRDRNVCEAYVIPFLFASVCEVYVIPFLFGSFFTVCHPYIDVDFVKCFLCYFTCISSSERIQPYNDTMRKVSRLNPSERIKGYNPGIHITI